MLLLRAAVATTLDRQAFDDDDDDDERKRASLREGTFAIDVQASNPSYHTKQFSCSLPIETSCARWSMSAGISELTPSAVW